MRWRFGWWRRPGSPPRPTGTEPAPSGTPHQGRGGPSIDAVHQVYRDIERRLSVMVMSAAAIEELVTAAGRDVDPEARAALSGHAATIRTEGRGALAEIRRGADQLGASA